MSKITDPEVTNIGEPSSNERVPGAIARYGVAATAGELQGEEQAAAAISS